MGAILIFEDALQCQVSQPMELPQNVDAKLAFVNKNFRLGSGSSQQKQHTVRPFAKQFQESRTSPAGKENRELDLYIYMSKSRKTFPWTR